MNDSVLDLTEQSSIGGEETLYIFYSIRQLDDNPVDYY